MLGEAPGERHSMPACEVVALQVITNTLRRVIQVANPFQCWFPVQLESSRIQITTSWSTLLFKTATTIAAIVSFGYAISIQNVPLFFFAYFTIWGATLTCFYLVLSCLNSWMQLFRHNDSFLQSTWKPLWLLMELATHSGLLSSFGTWGGLAFVGGLEEFKHGEESFNFSDIVWHGPFFILAVIDGVLINKMEYRWSHWTGCILPFDLTYIIWTVLHAFLIGVNPDVPSSDNQVSDFGAIYAQIIWKTNWRFSLLSSFVAVFVAGASGFGFLFVMAKRLGSVEEADKVVAPEETC